MVSGWWTSCWPWASHRAIQGAADLADLGLDRPQRLRRLLGQLERGEVIVTVHHEGLDKALAELNRIDNRLAMSILTAALIVGLGLLMLIYHPPGWAAWGGWFFGLAFFAVVALGLGLMRSIWWSR